MRSHSGQELLWILGTSLLITKKTGYIRRRIAVVIMLLMVLPRTKTTIRSHSTARTIVGSTG